jgi:hypothetical protein
VPRCSRYLVGRIRGPSPVRAMRYPRSTQPLDPPIESHFDSRQDELRTTGARLGATVSVRRSAIRRRRVRSIEEMIVTRRTIPRLVFLRAEEVIQ